MVQLAAEVPDIPPCPISNSAAASTGSAALAGCPTEHPLRQRGSSLDGLFLYGNIKVTKGFEVVKTDREALLLAYSLNWK